MRVGIVLTSRNAIGSANMAEDIFNSGVKDGEQTLSLKEMQDMARTRAQKEFPDDAVYARHAVDAMDHRFREGVVAENQARWSNKQIIAGAQMAGANTLQKLLADPAASESLRRLASCAIKSKSRSITINKPTMRTSRAFGAWQRTAMMLCERSSWILILIKSR